MNTEQELLNMKEGGAAPPDHSADVQVTVEYLPAAQPFHREYAGTATIETVRTETMVFFGVSDHQDRDTHRFFLEFEGHRLTDTTQTLDQLLGHRRGVHFNLIEEIIQGSWWKVG